MHTRSDLYANIAPVVNSGTLVGFRFGASATYAMRAWVLPCGSCHPCSLQGASFQGCLAYAINDVAVRHGLWNRHIARTMRIISSVSRESAFGTRRLGTLLHDICNAQSERFTSRAVPRSVLYASYWRE